MTNGTTPSLDDCEMVKVVTNGEMMDFGKETPEPTPLIRSMELQEQNGKAHVPDDLDPDPSLSYSPSKKKKRNNNK